MLRISSPLSTRFANRTLGAALLILAALSGCTSAPQTRQLLQSPAESPPRRALVADVPFFAQEQYQCGPAALAMALRFSGVAADPQSLVDQVYLPARQGSLQPEMLAASRRVDRLPYSHPPRLDALLTALDNGLPVLVLLNQGLDSIPRWHYAVLIGYDLSEETVTLHSGVTERMIRPLALFEQSWRKGGFWALSLLDPSLPPPAALDLQRYLQAALDLSKGGRQKSAQQAFASARQSWPDSPLPWMLEGNGHYAAARYRAAEQAFRHAINLDPSLIAAWNNLAYALVGQECALAARASLSCGLRLSPDSEILLDSQKQLGELPASPSAVCPPVTCTAQPRS